MAIFNPAETPAARRVTAATTLASVILLGGLAGHARAAAPLAGVNALAGVGAKVSATLVVSPGSGLQQTIDIALTPLGATAPATQYETELSKQLHVIAVSADLRDFVHEHGDAPAADGHFRVPMTFPHAGTWHIYADAVPQGLGQQVMRFDLALDAASPGPASPAVFGPSSVAAEDGAYGARFDNLRVQAGAEAELSIHLLHDGKPAADVTPFLGVAAHAVFIEAAGLGYVHVHAAPIGPAGDMGHDASAMKDMAGMGGMGPALEAGSPVPPDLGLHVRAPKAGTYVLWLQFNGGGQVRTVRFVVPVG